MSDSTKVIASAPSSFDISTIKTVVVKAKSESKLDAKAGHLLFWDSTDKLFKIAAAADVNAEAGRCVVLVQDASFEATTEKDVPVIVAGIVYDQFVRSAGFDEAKISDLRALNSGITFLDRKEIITYA